MAQDLDAKTRKMPEIMRIVVRVVGVLEAEMELPEPGSIGALGVSNWSTWHSNQYELACGFIEKCAVQAAAVMRSSIVEPTPPKE